MQALHLTCTAVLSQQLPPFKVATCSPNFLILEFKSDDSPRRHLSGAYSV